VTTLSNGMRVATETTPGESVAVGVFIKSGSRYETDESNGSVCACVGVWVFVGGGRMEKGVGM
jgi:hypothetical protein